MSEQTQLLLTRAAQEIRTLREINRRQADRLSGFDDALTLVRKNSNNDRDTFSVGTIGASTPDILRQIEQFVDTLNTLQDAPKHETNAKQPSGIVITGGH